MLFYSFEFMYLFLPVSLLGYYLIGGRQRNLSVKWVVACSLFFYGWWNPLFIPLLIVSIVFNYTFGLLLQREKSRVYLAVGVGFNLLLIGYFKYTGFFLSIAGDLTGQTISIGKIILPLGISFFTFQQISWLVDNYAGKITQSSRGIWEYGQFVTFFPQLIAGPIVHHSEMMPQFFKESNRFVTLENMAAGITMFVIGLSKKVIVADSVAPFANLVFKMAKSGDTLSLIDSWIGALAYTTQIYFDFSGYADMAIGLGLMFNIHLPLNFNSPYKAVSISAFWRRWHMTLGQFLKDYVYIPLGGNKGIRSRVLINLGVTFFLCGLWHGAGWTFILWGMLHGFYIIAHRLWGWISDYRLPRLLSVFITFFSVTLAWVVFRAESLSEAWAIFKAMGDFSSGLVTNAPGIKKGLEIILPALGVCFLLPNSQTILKYIVQIPSTSKKKTHFLYNFLIWRPNFFWAGYMVLLCILSIYCLLDQSTVQEFIYFQF